MCDYDFTSKDLRSWAYWQRRAFDAEKRANDYFRTNLNLEGVIQSQSKDIESLRGATRHPKDIQTISRLETDLFWAKVETRKIQNAFKQYRQEQTNRPYRTGEVTALYSQIRALMAERDNWREVAVELDEGNKQLQRRNDNQTKEIIRLWDMEAQIKIALNR